MVVCLLCMTLVVAVVWLIVLYSLVLLVFVVVFTVGAVAVLCWICDGFVVSLMGVFRLEFAYHFVFGCWFGRFVLTLAFCCVVYIADCRLFGWFVGCCMI